MRRHKFRGFTLIEVLVTMALSSIACVLAMQLWFGHHVSVLDRHKRNIETLGVQTACMALDMRISKAAGFTEISDSRIIWEESSGAFDSLERDGDSLRLNGRVVVMEKVIEFIVNVSGPTWPADSTDKFAKWIRLDLNGDSHLDQEELDVNYSRTLDQEELRRVALLELQIHFENGSSTVIRRAMRE